MSISLKSYSDKIIAHSTPKPTVQSKSHSIQMKKEINKKISLLVTKFDFKRRPQRSKSEAFDMKPLNVVSNSDQEENLNKRETSKRSKSPIKGINKKFKVNILISSKRSIKNIQTILDNLLILFYLKFSNK